MLQSVRDRLLDEQVYAVLGEEPAHLQVEVVRSRDHDSVEIEVDQVAVVGAVGNSEGRCDRGRVIEAGHPGESRLIAGRDEIGVDDADPAGADHRHAYRADVGWLRLGPQSASVEEDGGTPS